MAKESRGAIGTFYDDNWYEEINKPMNCNLHSVID